MFEILSPAATDDFKFRFTATAASVGPRQRAKIVYRVRDGDQSKRW